MGFGFEVGFGRVLLLHAVKDYEVFCLFWEGQGGFILIDPGSRPSLCCGILLLGRFGL